MAYCINGVMECWTNDIGIIAYRTMAYWNNIIMECWNNGINEY